jgi:hypothetical protein
MTPDIVMWLSRYRQLAERAAIWLRAGRKDDWLLDAKALQEAEAVINRRPAEAPEINSLVLEFVRRSRCRGAVGSEQLEIPHLARSPDCRCYNRSSGWKSISPTETISSGSPLQQWI